MNKKPYKDIEQLMKAAAEAHQPAFDEQSWKKMEALLDKDKDRKKPFFWLWWLLPLLIATGVGGYIIFNNNQQSTIAKNSDNKIIVNDQKINTAKITDSEPRLIANHNGYQLNNVSGKVKEKESLKNHSSIIAKEQSNISTKLNNELTDNENQLKQKGNLSDKSNGKVVVKIQSSQAEQGYEKINDSVNISSLKENKKDVLIIAATQEKTPLDTNAKNATKEKTPVRKLSNFYFGAALGIEANGVKLFSNSEYTARYGVSLGYQFNKNISLQTGFFVSNKKYVAGPDDYKAKDGTYWSYVDIIEIDAKCLVYEIPLLIRYDFTPGKKVNIFATTGLSSYIMRNEEYHYYYYYYGSPRDASASYTGNQNLFSVLRISAGVEKKLSSQFSLNLSPGLAIPLAGVGEGEVKLYSADVMISLKFTPLKKK